MIATLRGRVTHVGLDQVVLEVGGVGLIVHTTPAVAGECRTGQETQLYTTMVVREESLTLYGFTRADARALFEQVQTVPGVGPRLALAMLSVHTPDDVRQAIRSGDLPALTKVPGIGRKGAERIVLELRDAMGAVPVGGGTSGDQQRPAGAVDGQVEAALVGLGWSSKQAGDAVAVVRRTTADGTADVAGLLRAALRELGR